MVDEYSPTDAFIKPHLLLFVNQYLAAIRTVYYNDPANWSTDEKDFYFSPGELSYLEDYACGLFERLNDVGSYEYKVNSSMRRAIYRVTKLYFMPDSIKNGLNNFIAPYDAANIKERECELVLLRDSLCNLSELALIEMYISDVISIVSSLNMYVRGEMNKSSVYDSIINRLEYCSTSLSSLLVQSEDGYTIDVAELEMLIQVFESLGTFSDLTKYSDNIQVAHSLLLFILDREKYTFDYKSCLDSLLDQLQNCNNMFKMQQAWLKKRDSSVEWMLVLIISLIHVSYKVIYDDKHAARFDILMCMRVFNDHTRAKIHEQSNIFLSSEYILLSMLKFAVHLPDKIPELPDEPIEKHVAKIQRLSFG